MEQQNTQSVNLGLIFNLFYEKHTISQGIQHPQQYLSFKSNSYFQFIKMTYNLTCSRLCICSILLKINRA